MEAPRRLLIECPHWVGRHFLALRVLYSWAKEPLWPARGTPIAIALYFPLAELNNKKSLANYVEKVRINLKLLLNMLHKNEIVIFLNENRCHLQ